MGEKAHQTSFSTACKELVHITSKLTTIPLYRFPRLRNCTYLVRFSSCNFSKIEFLFQNLKEKKFTSTWLLT